MKKKEFIDKVCGMKNPVLSEESDCEYAFLNCYWSVMDLSDCRNCFCTPLVRLSTQEYFKRKEGLEAYYRREDKLRNKYNRWFEEAIGKVNK